MVAAVNRTHFQELKPCPYLQAPNLTFDRIPRAMIGNRVVRFQSRQHKDSTISCGASVCLQSAKSGLANGQRGAGIFNDTIRRRFHRFSGPMALSYPDDVESNRAWHARVATDTGADKQGLVRLGPRNRDE